MWLSTGQLISAHYKIQIACLVICLYLSATSVVLPNTVPTVAGGGSDNLSPLSANLDTPAGVAAGSFGIYYVSAGNRVYAVNTLASPQSISALAGNGRGDYKGDGGNARSAVLNGPAGLALDGSFLYVADAGINLTGIQIQSITPNFYHIRSSAPTSAYTQ